MGQKYLKTPFDAITYKVNGCAMAVHRDLGPGLREDSYERALAMKLGDAGIAFEKQKHYEVLLINFGERSLRVRRVFPPAHVLETVINRQWLFVPDWLKH